MIQTVSANSEYYSEPGDASDDDDDIEIGGVTQDYKCPLTLTPLQDPMTSYASPSPFATFPVSNGARILGKLAVTPFLVLRSVNTSLVVCKNVPQQDVTKISLWGI